MHARVMARPCSTVLCRPRHASSARHRCHPRIGTRPRLRLRQGRIRRLRHRPKRRGTRRARQRGARGEARHSSPGPLRTVMRTHAFPSEDPKTVPRPRSAPASFSGSPERVDSRRRGRDTRRGSFRERRRWRGHGQLKLRTTPNDNTNYANRVARFVLGSPRNTNGCLCLRTENRAAPGAVRAIRVVIRVSWQFGCPWPLASRNGRSQKQNSRA
jgi:hypothetical protein